MVKILPKYEICDRLTTEVASVWVEYDHPNREIFMPIGYDKGKDDGLKHYRRYYTDELENVKDTGDEFIVDTPFVKRQIKRAKKLKSGGLIGSLFGGDTDTMEEYASIDTGYFKGMVRTYNPEEYAETKDAIAADLKDLLEAVSIVFR